MWQPCKVPSHPAAYFTKHHPANGKGKSAFGRVVGIDLVFRECLQGFERTVGKWSRYAVFVSVNNLVVTESL